MLQENRVWKIAIVLILFMIGMMAIGWYLLKQNHGDRVPERAKLVYHEGDRCVERLIDRG